LKIVSIFGKILPEFGTKNEFSLYLDTNWSEFLFETDCKFGIRDRTVDGE